MNAKELAAATAKFDKEFVLTNRVSQPRKRHGNGAAQNENAADRSRGKAQNHLRQYRERIIAKKLIDWPETSHSAHQIDCPRA